MSAHNTNTSRVEEITAVLRTEILLGQYRPGERLPSERDLSTRFEVNRGAVREALKKLEQLGITDTRPGGVRVVPIEDATLEVLGHLMDLEELPNPKLINQLFEVFGALMSMSVRTAVEKATQEQLSAMREMIKKMTHSKQGTERDHEDWKEFGDYLSLVNDNLVLKLISNGLKTQFMGRLERVGVLIKPDKTRSKNTLKELDNAICERDGDRASQAILAHFSLLSSIISTALVQEKRSSLRSFSHG